MKGALATAAVIAFLATFSLTVQPSQAVTCAQVDIALITCVGYLTGHVDTPPKACCQGVATVKGLAQTIDDKKACCNCVKAAAGKQEDLKDEAAKSLPTKCGVQFDIPISRNVDCNNIK